MQEATADLVSSSEVKHNKGTIRNVFHKLVRTGVGAVVLGGGGGAKRKANQAQEVKLKFSFVSKKYVVCLFCF